MTEVISVKKAVACSKELKYLNKKIVLAGGCFDILHPGHKVFLQKAKQSGDSLIILLESDEKVKILKGVNRPIHNQDSRAQALAALGIIEYIVMLPVMKNDQEYDQLILGIKPDVIATTSKDKNLSHHKRAANLTGAKLKEVTQVVGNYSTSSLVESLNVQYQDR
ncbi:adenylyltransferase/cytidyltransferase family protein [Candidatus Daviesbacteria bacterium]|nr:adenylyltransferase/cytidyltransferase family protein [Candidatus Daviesbacteria bacterium]